MPFYSDFLDSFTKRPQRVVSLVPSLTDTLLHFNLEGAVQGITDFCPWTSSLPEPRRVGGTKTPDVDVIRLLQPDLILADREENEKAVLEALEREGFDIWLMYLPSLEDVLAMLGELVRVFQCDEQALQRLRTFENSFRWASMTADPAAGMRYFCPIWQGEDVEAGLWWMTFNRQTYCEDLLTLCGGRNCFSARERRYPLQADLGLVEADVAGGRDQRYPRVTADDVVSAAPEIILIPDEPYTFSESDQLRMLSALRETPAVQHGRISRIDGRDLTWNGVRAFRALAVLPAVFQGFESKLPPGVDVAPGKTE